MKATFLFLTVTLTLSSCASYYSTRDAHLAREYLTSDIENEVIFNLIRAANGLPFAHYDVVSVQSVVTDRILPNAGGTRVGASNGFVPTAVMGTLLHTVTRTLNAGVSAERANAVTTNIAPVVNDPKIYAAYVNFLRTPHKTSANALKRKSPTYGTEEAVISTKTTETDGGMGDEKKLTSVETTKEFQPSVLPEIDFGHIYALQSSVTEPSDRVAVVHTKRKWEDGQWYYVPVEYKPEFSYLCMAMVARGAKASPAGSGGSAAQEDTAKALQQLNSQLMQQNSIGNPR